MNSLALLQFSDKLNIPVYNFRTTNKKAFCVQDAIAVDFSRIETERECKQILTEELGHVICGALYPLSQCNNSLYSCNVKRQERKAMDYALKLQVSLEELKSAIKCNNNDFDIAEELDIDIDTLHEVVKYYKRKGVL